MQSRPKSPCDRTTGRQASRHCRTATVRNDIRAAGEDLFARPLSSLCSWRLRLSTWTSASSTAAARVLFLYVRWLMGSACPPQLVHTTIGVEVFSFCEEVQPDVACKVLLVRPPALACSIVWDELANPPTSNSSHHPSPAV